MTCACELVRRPLLGALLLLSACAEELVVKKSTTWFFPAEAGPARVSIRLTVAGRKLGQAQEILEGAALAEALRLHCAPPPKVVLTEASEQAQQAEGKAPAPDEAPKVDRAMTVGGWFSCLPQPAPPAVRSCLTASGWEIDCP